MSVSVFSYNGNQSIGQKVQRCENHLKKGKNHASACQGTSFTDEQKEIFEKFHDCWDEYVNLAEAAIFEYAFKLGMQIAIETLTE